MHQYFIAIIEQALHGHHNQFETPLPIYTSFTRISQNAFADNTGKMALRAALPFGVVQLHRIGRFKRIVNNFACFKANKG